MTKRFLKNCVAPLKCALARPGGEPWVCGAGVGGRGVAEGSASAEGPAGRVAGCNVAGLRVGMGRGRGKGGVMGIAARQGAGQLWQGSGGFAWGGTALGGGTAGRGARRGCIGAGGGQSWWRPACAGVRRELWRGATQRRGLLGQRSLGQGAAPGRRSVLEPLCRVRPRRDLALPLAGSGRGTLAAPRWCLAQGL